MATDEPSYSGDNDRDQRQRARDLEALTPRYWAGRSKDDQDRIDVLDSAAEDPFFWKNHPTVRQTREHLKNG
jgi:hypothetical protein